MAEEEQETVYLSPRQFAAALGLHVNAVYHLIYRGRLEGVISSKPDSGRAVHLIPASEVEEFPKRRLTWKNHGQPRAERQSAPEQERGRHQGLNLMTA